MKNIVLIVVFYSLSAAAQGSLAWTTAISVPLLATQSNNALFYVASYNASGTHTDYDMARQAADAYLLAHPSTPTFVVLNPSTSQTCDAVPLPTAQIAVGVASSVSIIGYGSNSSGIVKKTGCAASVATLILPPSQIGMVTSAVYQGFTVDAGHIDDAACGFYGMTRGTLFDLSCGNASAGGDHEAEFGTPTQANGIDLQLTIYNLKTFDSVGTGKGAALIPGWDGGSLADVSLGSGGTKLYTRQYTRAQLVGPDLVTCSSIPQVVPVVSTVSAVTFPNLPTVQYGYITGAVITSPGKCARTQHLYLLIQDGVPITYGMKFSDTTRSHVWNLEPSGSTAYGVAWLQDSSHNQIYGEHPYTNQTVQIAEYGVGNQHNNTFFDSPGMYGAAIYGSTGEFVNSIFAWDGSEYLASSGYYFGASSGYSGWSIQNSQCTNSTPNFHSISNLQGAVLSPALPANAVTLSDIERCDGTTTIDWPTAVAPD